MAAPPAVAVGPRAGGSAPRTAASAQRARVVLVALIAAATLVACAPFRRASVPEAPSLRIRDLVHEGDAQRRASLELVLDGLAADAERRPRLAASRYERAIRVDASNPYAYLALARHSVDTGQPERALQYLDQTEVLLESQEPSSPGAHIHVAGLRGAALQASGREREAAPWLEEARQRAPTVWGDGHLSPDELR